MESIVSDIYNCIFSNKVSMTNKKCFICGIKEEKLDMALHFNDEHNLLSQKIWNIDYGGNHRQDDPYRPMLHFKDGCAMCGKAIRSGIVEHYIVKHPNIVTFLHEGNICVK